MFFTHIGIFACRVCFLPLAYFPFVFLLVFLTDPPVHSPSHVTKLVLFYFCFRDGTPGTQSVTEKFEVNWESVMVSSHGAIVMKFDGRGSGFQGTKLLHDIKRKLGSAQEKDQTDAVR